MIKTIFIDLDDTLIANHYVYYVPQLEAVKMICLDLEELSPPPIQIIEMTTKWQVDNIAELGYISKICFPQSFLAIYRQLCSKINRPPNPNIESAIAVCAMRYILEQYKLFPGVKDTLKSLPQRKIMVTRGVSEVQDFKIDNVELREYFDDIEIVKVKTPQTYTDLIEKYGLVAEETLMVGDSFRNDIKPALEAGLKAVQIEAGIVQWDWEHTLEAMNHKDYDFPVITTFSEIVNHLG